LYGEKVIVKKDDTRIGDLPVSKFRQEMAGLLNNLRR